MKEASALIKIIIPQYRMRTRMFDNVLNGIKDKDASVRIEGRTNHILWMAGNLVNCRYWLADVLGLPNKDPHEALFKDAKALDPNAEYPSMDTLKKEWHTISAPVYQQLLAVTDKQLGEAYPFGMNVSFVEENKLNMIGMASDRESYLFGQLGLMRRILGYEGMKYDMDETIPY